jgi:hypothetical protein
VKETDYCRLWRAEKKENVRLSNENLQLKELLRGVEENAKRVVAEAEGKKNEAKK